ncbi:hypothetical protein ACOSQ2_027163 [Xanthoceras sorbifolium]
MLKSKYLKGKYILSSLYEKGYSSCVWKGVKFGAKNLIEGLIWRVCNGCEINFWSYIWVPKVGILQQYHTCNLDDNSLKVIVTDFIVKIDRNYDKLCEVIHVLTIQHILCIHIDSTGVGRDNCIWGHSKDDEFSIKTAFAVGSDYFGLRLFGLK